MNIDLVQDLENVENIQKFWKEFLRVFSMKPSEITEELSQKTVLLEYYNC